MNIQFLAVREKTRNFDEGDNTLRLAMAKKVLDDDKVIIAAYGYEGGGCYSDYYAVLQLDEYQESVESILERHIGDPEDTEYYDDYQQLNEYIAKYCYYDEDTPFLNLPECVKDEYDKDTGIYDHEWDWDDEVHFAVSEDWQIFYTWKKDFNIID
jgi:hypothetical protein